MCQFNKKFIQKFFKKANKKKHSSRNYKLVCVQNYDKNIKILTKREYDFLYAQKYDFSLLTMNQINN
jgi:hypothetical protein